MTLPTILSMGWEIPERDGYDLNNKKIISHSFFVNKCNLNQEFIPDKPDEVFFTIIALTDSVDTDNYTHTDVSVSSRNHPHYIGQGFIKTKKNRSILFLL